MLAVEAVEAAATKSVAREFSSGNDRLKAIPVVQKSGSVLNSRT
jgi:hypothetical protein